MPNPIQEKFGGGGLGNMGNMVNQFQEFARNFQGDPRAQVQQLLNSGKMTQEQFNQLSNMANQFQRMLGGR